MKVFKNVKYFFDHLEWNIRWAIRRRTWTDLNKDAYAHFLYRLDGTWEYANKLVWGNKWSYDEFIDRMIKYEEKYHW